ncbi:MAG: IclR family transcriptional regulator [Rhizobiaceae bacterium]
MGTVGKALSLLDVVSRAERGMGLAEIAKLCGTDKATARRLLVELGRHGFIEQDAETKKYDLGSAPVRLARIREMRFPFLRIGGQIADELAERVGETVHLSKFAGGRLSTVHVAESSKAHRVSLDVGTMLPLHATASGIALLAGCAWQDVDAFLADDLERYTEHTVTSRTRLKELVSETRERGYSICEQGLETGTVSTGAAIKASGGQPVGTIAIAAPQIRVDEETLHALGKAAAEAAAAITQRYFGLDGEAVLLRRAG